MTWNRDVDNCLSYANLLEWIEMTLARPLGLFSHRFHTAVRIRKQTQLGRIQDNTGLQTNRSDESRKDIIGWDASAVPPRCEEEGAY